MIFSRRLLDPLLAWAGQAPVVGVSGGADSVGLLRALLLVGARPVVAHFDHALRPDSARDAEWVAALAHDFGLPFETLRVEVAAVARKRGWNLEDAARRLRYDFLTRTARQHASIGILSAHTRRDHAETVLMRLLRGEAVLSGILPQYGRVYRPWLDISRAEIEALLLELGQGWREDPTNADPAYTRAWLRSEVMPVLTARVPRLEENLARVGRYSQQDDEVLEALAARTGRHTPLAGQPTALLRRWVRSQLIAAGLAYHATHLDEVAQALAQQKTLHLTLPGGHHLTVTGGSLYWQARKWPQPDFDFPGEWTARTRQPGDRIRLPGGARKVSDVLGEARLPREERDRVPLLVAPGGVQWIGLTPPVWAVGAREQVSAPPDPTDQAMQEALRLARLAAVEHEVPVGAVVVDPTGRVVGRGHNTSRRDGDMTRHAELAALREAAACLGTPYLTGCTLAVTLEPCPMCLGACLEARIGRIVFGASNPKAGALGGVSDLLGFHWGHRPEVTGGVRAGEAARLLRETFQGLR
ncbi:tRNA lysidine(34) synthetase TilS [Deinococcus sp.]|uniref:tRNA lysidine(34) synthetase TilS n=1 Tax=Deinococcus sp. TaxID=47478 RepID=UPI0025C26126|nr:tRNA lysidine(34) synthetase TilS [Deinococcus sp.]